MKVYKDIAHLPHFDKAVITIGTFDGVHLGHLQIIHQLVEESLEIGGTPVVITFYPHPKQVIGKNSLPLSVLNTTEEKSVLLSAAGIENIVVVPFTEEFAKQSATDYINNFLVSCFHPHTIIIGYDHRFGFNREGDYVLLEQKASASGYQVKEIPKHVLDDITISSTAIRRHLFEGNILKANALLGYAYFFSGEVIHGNKLGRTIGFPTANLKLEDESKLIPADGVYAVKISCDNDSEIYKGMMNIGMKPTVNGDFRTIEVNIFEFDKNIYGRKIKIEFIDRIRDEERFGSIELLKKQLQLDRIKANELLGSN